MFQKLKSFSLSSLPDSRSCCRALFSYDNFFWFFQLSTWLLIVGLSAIQQTYIWRTLVRGSHIDKRGSHRFFTPLFSKAFPLFPACILPYAGFFFCAWNKTKTAAAGGRKEAKSWHRNRRFLWNSNRAGNNPSRFGKNRKAGKEGRLFENGDR